MTVFSSLKKAIQQSIIVTALFWVLAPVTSHADPFLFLCGDATSDFGDACSLAELIDRPMGSVPRIDIDGTEFSNFTWVQNCCPGLGSLGPNSLILVEPIDSKTHPGLLFTDTGNAWSRNGLTVTLNNLTFDVRRTGGSDFPIYARRMFAGFGAMDGYDLAEQEDSSVFIREVSTLNGINTAPNETGLWCFASEIEQGNPCHFSVRRDGHPSPNMSTPVFQRWHDFSTAFEFNLIAEPGGVAQIEWFAYRLSLVENTDIAGLQDMNTNGSPEIAVVGPGGSNHVRVRDAFTGGLVSDLDYGDDPVVKMEVIDDVNGNGMQEIALLGTRPGGNVRVQVKDSLTGSTVKNLFYGSLYQARDMTVLPDTDNNGADELAVMGNASGAIRVQSKDPLSNAATGTSFFGATVTATNVAAIPDVDVLVNDNPEVLINGFVTATGITIARMHDSVVFGLPGFLGNLYFGNTYVPIALEAIGDVSGDGVADLVHLGRDDTGVTRIQIKRSDTKLTFASGFLGDVGTPIQVIGIGDANADTWPDVALLVEDPFDGAAKIIVRDGRTGAFVRNIFLGAISNPIAMALLDDMNGGGDPELAVLGDNGLGTVRVQIKDSVSGQQLGNIDFPF